MSADKLTVPEKLLIAALSARQRSATFSAEDLVVEAWTKYPDTFGLSGYAHQYPDSNRVLTNIMGTKGMRGKGWLRKVGEKRYNLTSAGLNAGEQILAGMQTNTASGEEMQALRAELDRQTTGSLGRLLGTPLAHRILNNERTNISFNEACGFWDITVRSNANTLQSRLADVSAVLSRALAAAKIAGEAGSIQVGNTSVTTHQIRQMMSLNEEMQKQFQPELDILRKRTDERLERRPKTI